MSTSERSALAYVVVPAQKPRATVAVLHVWWGVTEVVTGACDNLAGHGYVAVAPDLFGGAVATTAEQAADLRRRRRSTPMWRQIVKAVDLVRSEHGAEAVGQVGFSMGGHWALWLAKQSRPEIPTISATTVFYEPQAALQAWQRTVDFLDRHLPQ